MSQVYSTEPQTTGNVILETTHGPISINLWCKECPYTVRYFLQLCIDGYYDNLIFHRIIPNFLIQTGNAEYRQQTTASGKEIEQQFPPGKYQQRHGGQQVIERQKYELNSRIQFNHRGQVAMAMTTIDDDINNESEEEILKLVPQFFITLEETTHLTGKHVCFGTVSGPTIFNVLRVGQQTLINETTYEPQIIEEAPRILKIKIVEANLPPTIPPLLPTTNLQLLPWKNSSTASDGGDESKLKKNKKRQRKGVKNINLLSFGDDEEMVNDDDDDDDDAILAKKKKKQSKIQSSHDVLAGDDTTKSRLVNEIDTELQRRLQDNDNDDGNDKDTSRIKEKKAVESSRSKSLLLEYKDENETSDKNNDKDYNDKNDGPLSRPVHTFIPHSINNEIIKKNKQQEQNDDTTLNKRDKSEKPKKKKVSLVEARRAKYTKKSIVATSNNGSNNKKEEKQQREVETLSKFMAFQQNIIQQQSSSSKDKKETISSSTSQQKQQQHYHGQILENDDDEDDAGIDWIKTKFKCKRHIDQDTKDDMGGDGRNRNDYVVIEERNEPTDRKHINKKRKPNMMIHRRR